VSETQHITLAATLSVRDTSNWLPQLVSETHHTSCDT